MKRKLIISGLLLTFLLGGCASGNTGEKKMQSTTDSDSKAESQTVTEAFEPASERTSGSVVEPASEPTSGSVVEPTSEHTSEPVVEPASERTSEPVVEPASEDTSGNEMKEDQGEIPPSTEYPSQEKEPAANGVYTQISQEEARKMMEKDDGHVIVDVRRIDEYMEGHIPGAILISNEDIQDTPPSKLPDKDQIILIYCRSGRRSKEASQKLADMGYTRIYEFGGIIDWTGDVAFGREE